MNPTNNRIIVRVNLLQKSEMVIGGVLLKTALPFDTNYREKSPVIAEVVDGNGILKRGDIIVCHHNHFYSPSPYFMQDDLYSIPFNKTIFARVSKNGNLSAICGNVLGDRVAISTDLDLPPEFQKTYIDRLLVTDKGWTTYKNGTTVICRPNAPYDIVYNWGGVEMRKTKLDSDMICGFLK